MNDITHNYVIQWVGPFSSDEEITAYFDRGKRGEMCSPDCFSFYFITGVNRIGRPKIHSYFGVHYKLDGIHKRLNLRHPILQKLKEDDNLQIWIGAMGDLDMHSRYKVDEIETIFIRHYRWLLTDNDRKKKTLLSKLPSLSVINLWYNTDEKPYLRKPSSVCNIDDVIVWENDRPHRLLKAAKLSERDE